MKRVAAFVLAALALASPASADEMDVEMLLEGAKPARDRYERCTALAAKRELRGGLNPEEVARRALASCRREEAALKSVLRAEMGAARAQAVIDLVRGIDLANLARAVRQLRERP